MSKGKKRLLILLALFSVALTLMSFQHGRRPVSFTEVVSYPYDVLNRFTAHLMLSFKKARTTFDENERMKKELTQLLIERQRYNEIIQENKRLKELLQLKEHQPRVIAAAKVIARGYDRLLSTVIIDKGRAAGIEKGMAVITTRGLVGKVYTVRDDFSDVLLMKDSNFSVAVRLQNSRQEGVVSGTGLDRYLLKYVPPEGSVTKGEVVVTSGLDGVFPEGIPVGVVGTVKREGVEFFQHIEVVPFQSSATIEEVIVLKKEGGR
ncbi:MAG: rod shape-determining protein MreC [Nitrospirota bacterium]